MTYTLRDLESLETRELPTGQYTVGREAGNDFHIDADTLSRHHAWLHNAEDAVWLMDAGSTNGTRLNDAKVGGEWVQVKPGDIIMFGSAGFRLEHAIVGDSSLEGQLPPEPAPQAAEAEEAAVEEIPAAAAEPEAELPAAAPEEEMAEAPAPTVRQAVPDAAATGPLEEVAPAAQPAPRLRPVPKPSSRIVAAVRARNGGAHLVPPQAPALEGAKRPVARIELPDPEPTIALPEVELEAAQREVDRLVARANFIAQSRRLDVQSGRAQQQANFRSNIPPLRAPSAKTDNLKPMPAPVRSDDRAAAAKVKTDRFGAAAAPAGGSRPPMVVTPAVPVQGAAPRPAAVVEPPPPGPPEPEVKPVASPAAFAPPPRRRDGPAPMANRPKPTPVAKPASEPLSVPAAARQAAPIAQPSSVAAPIIVEASPSLAQKALYGGIGMALGTGIGILLGLYVLGG